MLGDQHRLGRIATFMVNECLATGDAASRRDARPSRRAGGTGRRVGTAGRSFLQVSRTRAPGRPVTYQRIAFGRARFRLGRASAFGLAAAALAVVKAVGLPHIAPDQTPRPAPSAVDQRVPSSMLTSKRCSRPRR
jgi:hypothetical protein